MHALVETHFNLPGQTAFYKGKVRDVYSLSGDVLAMVACDRISAFDVVLPKPIPYKGQVLNQIAAFFLKETASMVPNWLISTPDPNVSIGHKCRPLPVEMVIRGYLAGHAWREYKSGKRIICGVAMPDGMRENDPFPEPIITPTIKASEGHDEDITRDEILKQGLATEEEYLQLENYTRMLYRFGADFANKRGLILVDTKYEFGVKDGKVMLMDEIHTPDSSRYFYKDTYEEIQSRDQQQRQLSKEFVRQWLIANGFQGRDGEQIPDMDNAFIETISNRYIELYEHVTGLAFIKQDYQNVEKRVEAALLGAL
ncbi:MAG: phosphoribosylaminoimidazolesuccinocarboxamide synthase [Bacteroidia bacterium]|nr:phosphoribosylaminoimidazolesuccinocarboxamide synthase [Bacteroidia bacterium]